MQEKGLEIVRHIRAFCDSMAAKTKLNWTCLATPAEGLSGRFIRMDKKRYGIIPGVTDRDYYTNSFHVPVYYKIGAIEKIRKEAPYHALTNAGHITYVELDGDMAIGDFLELTEIDEDGFDFDSETVGGWVMELNAGFADPGDTLRYGPFTVTVLEADDKRVERVRITREPDKTE